MKTSLLVGSLVLSGCAMMPAQASVATYQARQAQASPGQILTWLKAGNQRFAAGAKVLVVLGHTDCGGIKGACSNLQLGHMTQLLERIKPAIGMTNAILDANPVLSKEVGERVVGNRRYIAQVSHMNAIQSARQILQRSPLLREKVSKGDLILIPAIYDVDSGVVRFDAPAH